VLWPPSQFEAAFLSTAHLSDDLDRAVAGFAARLRVPLSASWNSLAVIPVCGRTRWNVETPLVMSWPNEMASTSSRTAPRRGPPAVGPSINRPSDDSPP
jgi:hypothetical protein